MKKLPATPHLRSDCAIACTLDLVGDKWSLLVVRDLLPGRKTFKDLLAAPEAIPTNVLAERLKRLEAAGLVRREAYQERPLRHTYELTPHGRDLGEVLLAYVRWGRKHLPGTKSRVSP